VRLRQYARRVEEALRPTLAVLDLPLILAGSEPLESIFRSVSTYPHLARAVITGNPDTKTDGELADASRRVLDELYSVVDEIARRVLLARGRVLALRRDDIPGNGPAAAILRYPV
jgi:hypothetical protein